MEKSITDYDVLHVLSRHIGAEVGIHIGALVEAITAAPTTPADERIVRRVVEKLRREGHHICATPRHGYFIARQPDELDQTCKFLYDRAMASLSQVAAMKRVSLPDLRGQLRLPT